MVEMIYINGSLSDCKMVPYETGELQNTWLSKIGFEKTKLVWVSITSMSIAKAIVIDNLFLITPRILISIIFISVLGVNDFDKCF